MIKGYRLNGDGLTGRHSGMLMPSIQTVCGVQNLESQLVSLGLLFESKIILNSPTVCNISIKFNERLQL